MRSGQSAQATLGQALLFAGLLLGGACGGRVLSTARETPSHPESTNRDDGSASGGEAVVPVEAGPDVKVEIAEASAHVESDAAPPSSCAPGGPGMTTCGPGGSGTESCCTSLQVSGGTFYRTYGMPDDIDPNPILAADGTNEADPATVSSFRLDKYLVTVGRFRQFAAAWNAGWTPPEGSGKHAHLNSGQGLANSGPGGGYETGWMRGDNANLAPTSTNLACNEVSATWTTTAGTQENLPMTCVNWYEGYAFCIWDGGFLPSESEWEYAAAGGSQQREYPWGSAAPGTASQYAIYDSYYPTGLVEPEGLVNIAPVGAPATGAARWGQLDMAGEMSEWTLDSYATYVNPCTDCSYLTMSVRVLRGGDFMAGSPSLFPPPPLRRLSDQPLRPALR